MYIVIILIFAVLIAILSSPKVKGAIGEAKVNAHLKFIGKDYESLHDIMIQNSKGYTTQIDHIILSQYGIFVVETKNYKGWIFGNEKAENWMQVIYKEKNQFRNPIKQNWAHIYALKELLKDFPNAKYFPIVVFSGSATLKEINSTIPVIYETYLNKTIKKLSTEKCLSAEEIIKMKSILLNSEILEKGSRKKHIQNIQRTIYERQSKIDNLICPRCNGELKLRDGKNGKFYGCSNYPYCRFTKPY